MVSGKAGMISSKAIPGLGENNCLFSTKRKRFSRSGSFLFQKWTSRTLSARDRKVGQRVVSKRYDVHTLPAFGQQAPDAILSKLRCYWGDRRSARRWLRQIYNRCFYSTVSKMYLCCRSTTQRDGFTCYDRLVQLPGLLHLPRVISFRNVELEHHSGPDERNRH